MYWDGRGAAGGEAGPGCEHERGLVERYMRAWETTDVERFAALLREDAVFSMPPWALWYRGAIARFFKMTGRPGGHAPFRW